MRKMHAFSYIELKEADFSLEKVMYRGMLPPHYLSPNPDEDLEAYTNLYLTEEISAEGLARNLPGFSRFMQTMATVNIKNH